MEFSQAQEDIFKIFDEIIDSGGDVWCEIQNDETLRKRVYRAFKGNSDLSSTKAALYSYGFNDYTYEPTLLELKRCLDVTVEGVFVNEYRVHELEAVTNMSKEFLLTLINRHKYEAFDEFVSNYISDLNSFLLSYTDLRDEHPRVFSYVANRYGNSRNFYNVFGINPMLIYYHAKTGMNLLAILGVIFEELVRAVLFPNESYQVVYKDCRPDFVINGNWVEIKLSKGTVVSQGDKSISKYLKYVDSFKVIYAIEDDSDVSFYEEEGFLEFIHISEYYKLMTKEEVRMFQEFIENASEYKRRLAS